MVRLLRKVILRPNGPLLYLGVVNSILFKQTFCLLPYTIEMILMMILMVNMIVPNLAQMMEYLSVAFCEELVYNVCRVLS